MTKPERYQALAKDAMRLLRQQDPEILSGVWHTTTLELMEAQKWLDTVTANIASPVEVPDEEKPIAAKFQCEIQAEIQRISDSLGRGGAKDFEHYKRLCGNLEGLRASLDYYTKLLTEDN